MARNYGKATDRYEEDCLVEYLGEIADHRLLDRDGEVELFQRYESGDTSAREELVRCNLRLVVKIALQFRNMGLPVADLIQEGNVGLLNVIERFDWRLGFRFSTYAAFYIRQEIQNALRQCGSMIRLPVRKARMMARINDAVRTFSAMEGRDPSINEIANLIGEESDRVAALMPMRESVVSLDNDPTGEGASLLDTMVHDGPSPEARASEHQMRDKVRGALEHLTEREREIIELRFGLRNGACLSLRKVSLRVGLSQEGVRRVEMRAMEKLRRPSSLGPLRELLIA